MLVIDNENPNQFKVVLNGDPNCNVSVPCQKSLDMIVDGVSVHLGAATNTSFVVKVDGNPISLPYTASSPLIKRVSDSYISFVETGISISQSVSQQVSQPVSQPITWPTRQSVGESVSQPVSQPITRPTRRSVGQSVSQSVPSPIACKFFMLRG